MGKVIAIAQGRKVISFSAHAVQQRPGPMADRTLNKSRNDSPSGGLRKQMDMCRSSIDFTP